MLTGCVASITKQESRNVEGHNWSFMNNKCTWFSWPNCTRDVCVANDTSFISACIFLGNVALVGVFHWTAVHMWEWVSLRDPCSMVMIEWYVWSMLININCFLLHSSRLLTDEAGRTAALQVLTFPSSCPFFLSFLRSHLSPPPSSSLFLLIFLPPSVSHPPPSLPSLPLPSLPLSLHPLQSLLLHRRRKL